MRRLGISIPIIQAPMAGVATPSLAAAVSNAGGLGGIGIGPMSHTAARKMILETRKLTDRPFNVNVFVHSPAVAKPENERLWIEKLTPSFQQYSTPPPKSLREIYTPFPLYPEMLEILLETRPPVVSFHFGLPPLSTISSLKLKDIILLATATNLEEARKIQEAGVDMIIAQGIEAGGHRGIFDPTKPDKGLSTGDLVDLLVKECGVPIIAAGGMMDGNDIAQMLGKGAVAAQLGTAFILCPESSADEGYRQILSGPAAEKTVLTRAISGRPARGLVNRLTELGDEFERDGGQIPDYPITFDAGKAIHTAAEKEGEQGFASHWAGMGAARARSMPAKELMETLITELEEAKAA